MAAPSSAAGAGSEGLSCDNLHLVRTFQSEPNARFTASLAVPSRPQVAAGATDGSVLIWPTMAGRARPMTLGKHGGPITCLAGSPSGDMLVSASTDSTVMVWENKAQKQAAAPIKVHFSPVRACDISRDERLVLSASDDKLVKLSSLPERRFQASLVGHTNWVLTAAFSPGAALVASGGDDRTVRLWDVETRETLRTWYDQSGTITRVCFDASECSVAACTRDGTINIWDARSHVLRQHYSRAHGSSPITSVAFNPSQDLLLSSSVDRTLRIWDLRAGKLLNTLSGHQHAVHSCSWTSNGIYFASGDGHKINLWTYGGFMAGSSQEDAARPAGRQQAAPLSPPSRGCWSPRSAAAVAAASERAARRSSSAAGRAAGEAATPASEAKLPSSDLGKFLQAAWAGPTGGAVTEALSASQATKVAAQQLPETLARTVEGLVTQMGELTKSLEALEARMMRTEAEATEVAGLLAERRVAVATENAKAAVAARTELPAAGQQEVQQA